MDLEQNKEYMKGLLDNYGLSVNEFSKLSREQQIKLADDYKNARTKFGLANSAEEEFLLSKRASDMPKGDDEGEDPNSLLNFVGKYGGKLVDYGSDAIDAVTDYFSDERSEKLAPERKYSPNLIRADKIAGRKSARQKQIEMAKKLPINSPERLRITGESANILADRKSGRQEYVDIVNKKVEEGKITEEEGNRVLKGNERFPIITPRDQRPPENIPDSRKEYVDIVNKKAEKGDISLDNPEVKMILGMGNGLMNTKKNKVIAEEAEKKIIKIAKKNTEAKQEKTEKQEKQENKILNKHIDFYALQNDIC